jgi:hypothetical protein
MFSKVLLLFVALGPVSLIGSDAPATSNMLQVAGRQAALLKASDRPFVGSPELGPEVQARTL